MIDDRPDPLVPPGVDLRDFAFMPLDVMRLRDSDLVGIASGEEFKAAVLLWCASWHQVPAASLPDDRRVLAKLAGFGRDVDAFDVVRDVALRHFVTCNDGRLYHPHVAEKALEAWEAKQARKARTAAATAARQASKQEKPKPPQPPKARDRNDQRNGNRYVHQGTGTGTNNTTPDSASAGENGVDRLSQIDPDSLEASLVRAVTEGGGTLNYATRPALFDLSPIIGLIDAGFDLETEILPIVRARSSGRDVRSWGYFVEAVHEARGRRAAAGRQRPALRVVVGGSVRDGPAQRRALPRDPVLQAREELLLERAAQQEF